MRRAGFTLVEIMLAILILAIMMSIVYGVVVSTVQAQRRIEEVTVASEIGPVLIAQIREDLEGAFRPDSKGEYFRGTDSISPAGDRDRIDFITARLAYGTAEDGGEPAFHSANEVGYLVRENPRASGLGVLYRRQDLFLDPDPLQGGVLVELYDRVSHFGVKYYTGEEWVDGWDFTSAQGKLPRAVQVDLRLEVTQHEDRVSERFYRTTVTFPKMEEPPPPPAVDGEEQPGDGSATPAPQPLTPARPR